MKSNNCQSLISGSAEIAGNKALKSVFEELDLSFVAKIRKYLRRPEVGKGAKLLGLNTETKRIQKFIDCNFSDTNMIPDFNNNELSFNEYRVCNNRGKCPAEGLFCKIPGNLTPREMQYSILVAEGCCDKEAASKMGISIHTANTYRVSVLQKLNFSSKLDIVRWVVMIAPNRFVKSIKF